VNDAQVRCTSDELVTDIGDLLRKQEWETGLPLVKMFQGMIEAEKTDQQRRQYGDGAARQKREIVLQTIEDHARSTGRLFLQSQVRLDLLPRQGR
jgi:hypothetical protein